MQKEKPGRKQSDQLPFQQEVPSSKVGGMLHFLHKFVKTIKHFSMGKPFRTFMYYV